MSKFTAMKVLGEMAKGGGAYFGEMHRESVRNRRLAEARGWREQLAEKRRTQQLADRDEQRAYSEEQAAEQRARTEELPPGVHKTVERADGTYAIYADGTTNKLDIPPEARVTETDTGVGSSGTPTDTEGGSSGGDMAQGEKMLAMRSTLGGHYVDTMKQIIGSEDEGGRGWDPTSWGAYGEKVANKFDIARGMASKEAQVFYAASEGAVAGILRTDTGAAAPTHEQENYTRRLVPGIGDGVGTVQWKMKTLDIAYAAMAAASKAGATEESIRRAGIQAAQFHEMENPRPAQEAAGIEGAALGPSGRHSARSSVRQSGGLSESAKRYMQ